MTQKEEQVQKFTKFPGKQRKVSAFNHITVPFQDTFSHDIHGFGTFHISVRVERKIKKPPEMIYKA